MSGSEAIDIALEHADSHALRAQLPYTRHPSGMDVDFGQLRAAPTDCQIWAQP